MVALGVLVALDDLVFGNLLETLLGRDALPRPWSPPSFPGKSHIVARTIATDSKQEETNEKIDDCSCFGDFAAGGSWRRMAGRCNTVRRDPASYIELLTN